MSDFPSSRPDRSQAVSFEDAVRFLESRINFEKLSGFSIEAMGARLDMLRQLLLDLGSPNRNYPIAHVAGTKGKGSTCVLLESVLRESGCRVGRFSSPHLDSLTERFTIDGVPCPEPEFGERMLALRDRIQAVRPDMLAELTYFELTTLFAFDYFASRKVDFAVFEVGLGGRFDATNLCQPVLTFITSIGFDHVEQLGPTLEAIAAEKGGIIKPGVPLISAVRHPGAKKVLDDIARSVNAPRYFLDDAFSIFPSGDGKFRFRTIPGRFPAEADLDDLSVPLPGRHQQRNAALAVAAALLLKNGADRAAGFRESTGSPFFSKGARLDAPTIRSGLAKGFLPARIEIVDQGPARPVLIFDGAHNRSSFQALIETLRESFPNRRARLVFGVSRGKDVEGMLSESVRYFEHLTLTRHSFSPRSLPPRDINAILEPLLDEADPCIVLRRKEIDIVEDAREALETVLRHAAPDTIVCVSGSLYLAAELRRCSGLVENFREGNPAKT